MKENEIRYIDIVNLAFDKTIHDDRVFENEYGYPYAIFTYKLTDLLVVHWNQCTRTCEIIRLDPDDEGSILNRYDVKDLKTLQLIIEIFEFGFEKEINFNNDETNQIIA